MGSLIACRKAGGTSFKMRSSSFRDDSGNVRWPQAPQPPGLGGFAGWRSEHLKHQVSQATILRVKGSKN